jgi:hypothetical protein
MTTTTPFIIIKTSKFITITFVSDLQQVCGFLRVLLLPPPIKLTILTFGLGIRTYLYIVLFVCLMVLNATFTNISVISWWSVLLVDETEVAGEKHRPFNINIFQQVKQFYFGLD